MIKPYDMTRIILAGPNSLQEKIIRELHKLKVLHIVEHTKDNLVDRGKPLESSNKLSEIIVRVRASISALGIKKDVIKTLETKRSVFEIDKTTKKIAEELNKNNEGVKKIDDLLARNAVIMQELKLLEGIELQIGAFKPYKTIEIIYGFVNSYDATYIKDSLFRITDRFILYQNTVGKKVFIVLFVDKTNKDDTIEILQKIGFFPVKLVNLNSNGLDKSKTAAESIKKVEIQRHRLESLKITAVNINKKLAKEFRAFLIAAEQFLSIELEKADAPLKFAATKDTFLVKGWLPTKQLQKTIERLNKVSKHKVFIHFEHPKIKDKVPVKLNNPNYAKPFEFFINIYSLPNYREIDPTFFMFLTFPIFFGFMLGDFGYGIVSFALFWLLKKKFQKFKNFFNILLLSSVSSIIFGLIYGELFGFEEIGHFKIPHLISRVHSITEMMYIAVAIGVIHINWGLVSGFVNVYKQHGLKHAIFEKGSWFILEIGVILSALSFLGKIHLHWLVGAIFLFLSVIMLYKGEGVKGIIELPSILTNTLSYLRLMAIGLSSVSIAVVVNELSESFFHEGGLLILAGILIMLIGHALNVILGLFGSFLHSLRLHYVEFFSKFFHGGAERYKPFGVKE